MNGKTKLQRKEEEIKRRKETCVPKVFWIKICWESLNRNQRELLVSVFTESKWLWNHLLL